MTHCTYVPWVRSCKAAKIERETQLITYLTKNMHYGTEKLTLRF